MGDAGSCDETQETEGTEEEVKRLHYALGAIACALLVGGCGASDEDQIRETMDTFLLGLADSDGDEACSVMTGDGQEQFAEFSSSGEDCDFGANAFASEAGYDFDSAEIDRVTIEGETATAGLADDSSTFDLVKEDGEWKLDGL